MKILLVGSKGFIGKKVREKIENNGFQLLMPSRQQLDDEQVMRKEFLSEAGVIINAAGSPVIRRWTRRNKQQMYDSRVSLIKKLVTHADPLKTRLIISVSAVGVYTSHGIHTEEKYIADDGFLGRLCLDWENAALSRNNEIRTLVLRLGVVIGKGGALNKMLPFFSLGIGGTIAGGKQFFPWIHIDDLCGVILSAISDESMTGVYNVVSPEIIDNKTFTKALARASGRRAWLNIPAFALRLLYGKGSQLLTKGQYVVPERLCKKGYHFIYPDINTALDSVM